MAVTFLFSFFSGLKSHGERIRLESENNWNGALFILKEEKKRKRGVGNGFDTEKIAGFLLFFVSLFFCFLIRGGKNFQRQQYWNGIFYDKRASENEFPKALILIFFVFLAMAPAKTKICMEQKFILLKQTNLHSLP